MMGWKYVLQVG